MKKILIILGILLGISSTMLLLVLMICNVFVKSPEVYYESFDDPNGEWIHLWGGRMQKTHSEKGGYSKDI